MEYSDSAAFTLNAMPANHVYGDSPSFSIVAQNGNAVYSDSAEFILTTEVPECGSFVLIVFICLICKCYFRR